MNSCVIFGHLWTCFLWIVVLVLVVSRDVSAAESLSANDLLGLKRMTSAFISPDGEWVDIRLVRLVCTGWKSLERSHATAGHQREVRSAVAPE